MMEISRSNKISNQEVLTKPFEKLLMIPALGVEGIAIEELSSAPR
jgi:hypothetical protein